MLSCQCEGYFIFWKQTMSLQRSWIWKIISCEVFSGTKIYSCVEETLVLKNQTKEIILGGYHVSLYFWNRRVNLRFWMHLYSTLITWVPAIENNLMKLDEIKFFSLQNVVVVTSLVSICVWFHDYEAWKLSHHGLGNKCEKWNFIW